MKVAISRDLHGKRRGAPAPITVPITSPITVPIEMKNARLINIRDGHFKKIGLAAKRSGEDEVEMRRGEGVRVRDDRFVAVFSVLIALLVLGGETFGALGYW